MGHQRLVQQSVNYELDVEDSWLGSARRYSKKMEQTISLFNTKNIFSNNSTMNSTSSCHEVILLGEFLTITKAKMPDKTTIVNHLRRALTLSVINLI